MNRRIKTSEAIEYFGSIKALATATGCTTQAISQWGEFVPDLREYQIEVLSKRKLKAGVKA